MEPVSTTPQVEQSQDQIRDAVSGIGVDYKPYIPLYDKFNVHDRSDKVTNSNLDLIWKWAESRAEVKDKDSILWEVTRLGMKLGEPNGSSAPYSRILSYVSEYNRMVEAEKRLKEFENGRA